MDAPSTAAIGARVSDDETFRRALCRAAEDLPLPEGTRVVVHAAGRGGTWVLGSEPATLQRLGARLAAELARPIRFYGASVIAGRLRGRGRTLHPDGAVAPIAAAREDAPAADPAEAGAWLLIRLEVQEGLDDHDARREVLVWPWRV